MSAAGWSSLPIALLAAFVAALLAGLLVGIAVGPVLRRLPEPAEPDGKIPYADLATRRLRIGTALAAAAAVGLAWLLAPPTTWPLWVVLGTGGVLLGAIDARTTWLPLPLTRLAWWLMSAAGMVGAAWAGFAGDQGAQLLRTAVGAVAAGGLYYLAWWVTRGGFGFGDVRFAPLVGAAAAASSWTVLIWALVLGSLVGGLVGVVRLGLRRREPFPYAPSILAGPYLALLLVATTGV